MLVSSLEDSIRQCVPSPSGVEVGYVNPTNYAPRQADQPVLDVLQEKHPELQEPPSVGTEDRAFKKCPNCPDIIPMTVTAEDVEKIASSLSGAAGPGGTDAVDMQNWLLQFGKESEAFCEEMAAWTNGLANTHPPWAAYRSIMMSNRLVALDKMPGTRPVGIGEVYCRLWAQCLLKVIGHQATTACGNVNLCAGLPAGIEGAVHAIQSLFEDPSLMAAAQTADPVQEDAPLTQPDGAPMKTPTPNPDLDQPDETPLADQTMEDFMGNLQGAIGLTKDEFDAVLLVDARNGFNKLGRKAMLWTVHHLWAGGIGLLSTATNMPPSSSSAAAMANLVLSFSLGRGVHKGTHCRWFCMASPSHLLPNPSGKLCRRSSPHGTLTTAPWQVRRRTSVQPCSC
jgi:hypothetical protein